MNVSTMVVVDFKQSGTFGIETTSNVVTADSLHVYYLGLTERHFQEVPCSIYPPYSTFNRKLDHRASTPLAMRASPIWQVSKLVRSPADMKAESQSCRRPSPHHVTRPTHINPQHQRRPLHVALTSPLPPNAPPPLTNVHNVPTNLDNPPHRRLPPRRKLRSPSNSHHRRLPPRPLQIAQTLPRTPGPPRRYHRAVLVPAHTQAR